MVHALHEAHRVLKPDAILIDLRPKHQHRRVGIGAGERWEFVGAMRERFDDDLAANHAVAQVLREGLVRRGPRIEFMLERVMDSLTDFHVWLDEFVTEDKFPSHKWLIAQVERALAAHRRPTKIVVRGPLVLRVLRKIS